MRLRHKPWAEDKLKEYPQYVITDANDLKGHWQTRFAQNQALHIEVGSGKGQFTIEMAKAHPHINYIAVEIQTSVIVSILDRQLEAQLPNLQILHADGRHLSQYFADGEVDLVYLNFSDPWPKTRHAKRRLTSPDFLSQYEAILVPNGQLHFKTDNQGLFEYSLASLSNYGLILNQVWLDLHHSDYVGNIETEYEHKFAAKGHRIYRLEATFDQQRLIALRQTAN
ncbi:tRNA (guanosine(46)-N7)-methyltransferase TrmB [Vaginisenegalia massiliensis]|uniref:tRNA (guanosine(46)-N7)-methyltransferase TrmB n=1 Tax=Vaginisenegalia massiliensis TaxID=2058294 RepID=UPI000F542AF0|nr:tRNA (guanosine(46)-N7)-methyltransferase TrmB [Vaginisenegalia massiliensis]